MKARPKILLIEDNAGDIELITGSFKNEQTTDDLKIIKNGEDALNYLGVKINGVPENRPDIILLDINIPKVNGKEILTYIKTSDKLKTIPVIMLTTSSLEADLSYCYANHANCYIVKPANLKEYIRVIQCIETFWLGCVVYPNSN